MTAPTYVGTAQSAWTSSTSPATSGSVTVQTGDLLVAIAGGAPDGFVSLSVSNSGTALTWTERASQTHPAAWGCAAKVWTAVAGSNTSLTVSAAHDGTGPHGVLVTVWRNATYGAAVDEYVEGAPSTSLTTTAADSAIVIGMFDRNGQDYTTRTWATVNSTVGTELVYNRAAGTMTAFGGYWPNAGTTGAKTIGVTQDNAVASDIVALEVKYSASSDDLTITAGTTTLTGSEALVTVAAALPTSITTEVAVEGAGAAGITVEALAPTLPSTPTTPTPDPGVVATFGGALQWFYGLQESSGSVTAGDSSGAAGRPTLTLTQTGTGGTVEFGSAGIMPEGTAVKFTPASAGNGLTLGTAGRLNMNLAGEFSAWCQFAWSGTTGVRLFQLGSASSVTVAATPTTVTATLVGATTATATKTITTNDNRPHWVLLSVTGSTLSLHVDQTAAATTTVPANMATAASLAIGGTTSEDPHQVAWVGYVPASTTAARSADLASLATGMPERSDLRVARWLRWLGLTADMALDVGLSDVAYQATGGQQMLDLANALNVVEGGVLFPTGVGTYRWQARPHRYASTVRATIPAEYISGDLQVVVDASRLVNDATVSRPSGATARAVNSASVIDYGTHSRVETVYAADDDAGRDVAHWWVNRYGTPHPYVPRVVVDLLTMTAADAQSLLGVDIGDRIQVTGLPAATTPGGATLDLFVEGVEESVSATSWSLTLATSPADLWAAALFDDPAALFDTAQFAY